MPPPLTTAAPVARPRRRAPPTSSPAPSAALPVVPGVPLFLRRPEEALRDGERRGRELRRPDAAAETLACCSPESEEPRTPSPEACAVAEAMTPPESGDLFSSETPPMSGADPDVAADPATSATEPISTPETATDSPLLYTPAAESGDTSTSPAPEEEPVSTEAPPDVADLSSAGDGGIDGGDTTDGGLPAPTDAEPAAEATETAPDGGSAPGPEGAAGGADAAALDTASMDELAAGDLDLIDTELAEHQRWRGAADTVGAAGSADRAAFVLNQIREGLTTGAAGGVGMGLSLGLLHRGLGSQLAARLGTRLAARMGSRALAPTANAAAAAARMAGRLGSRIGPRVAAQTARFTPLPAIGAVIGGVISFHSLYTRDWRQTRQTLANFGEGGSNYERLANSIAAISEVVDIVSNGLNVIAGIMGAITVGMWIAAVASAGALSPLAGTLTAISLAIGVVTLALDAINMLVLQPAVTLFRALHAFTSESDPREVVADGQALSAAAANNGGAIGGLLGARGANLGHGPPNPHAAESTRHSEDTPPPAAGAGPRVDFEARPASPETPATPTPAARPPAELAGAPPPVAAEGGPRPSPAPEAVPATSRPAPETAEAPTPTSPPPPQPTPAPVEQLTLPGVALTPATPAPTHAPPVPVTPAAANPPPPASTGIHPLTPPLELAGIRGTPTVPQGLEPGSIGNYGRAVANPHPAALASNPAGAPGATAGGGRLPQGGREAAGVYYEHQTPAAVAHEVLPGHEYDSPTGRRRGGRDTVEALATSFPESAKPIKDPLDAALLAEVRTRRAAGEEVPPVEVIVRGAEHSKAALAGSGASVDPAQVGRLFLAEMDDFHSPRFGYEETPMGRPLPEGHPFRDATEAELSSFVDRQFDPFIPAPLPPLGTQMSLPGMEGVTPRPPAPAQLDLPFPTAPDPRQLTLPFDGDTGHPLPAPFSPAEIPPPLPTADPALPRSATPTSPVSGEMVPSPAVSAALPPPPIAHSGSAPVDAIGVSPARLERERILGLGASASTASSSGRPAPGSDPSLLQTFFPIFYAGAHGPSPEEQQATFNAQFVSDFPPVPGEERANPAYADPPCTPAQIAAIRGHIEELRQARVQTTTAESMLDAEIATHTANEAPLLECVDTTAAGVEATAQLDEKVQATTEANASQQERQEQVSDAVSQYDEHSGAIDGLRTPLRAFQGMMDLASYLPGDAGEAMADMNRDATSMLASFDEMDATMASQQEGSETCAEQLQGEGAQLTEAGTEAATTDETMTTASTDALALQERNDAAVTDATDRRDAASDATATLDGNIEEQETRADSLAQQLQAWAADHRAARQAALATTEARVEGLGLTVTATHER